MKTTTFSILVALLGSTMLWGGVPVKIQPSDWIGLPEKGKVKFKELSVEGGKSHKVSYMSFDMDFVSSAQEIESVELVLPVRKVKGSGVIHLHWAASSWDGKKSYGNRPMNGDRLASFYVDSSDEGKKIKVNLTDSFRDWGYQTETNYGVFFETYDSLEVEFTKGLGNSKLASLANQVFNGNAPRFDLIFSAIGGEKGERGEMGPQGPMGPQGETGAVGPAGPIGPEGAQGVAGPAGPQGEVGPMGPQGETGAVGPVGPIGPEGAQGVAGPAGAQGEVGPMGPQGETGAVGPVGPVGPEGAQGVAGPAGPQGEVGPMGPQGETGAVGPAGPIGPQGAQGVDGPAGPQGEVGPMGPQGETGAVGPVGPVGPEGAQGVAGPAGPQGEVGPMGPQGETGAVGPAGPIGPEGAQGVAGPTGPQGEAGPMGPQGEMGPAGPQGPAGESAADASGVASLLSTSQGFSMATVSGSSYADIQGRSLTFTKAKGETRLRITYEDLMGTNVASPALVAATWRITLNGTVAGGEKALVESQSAGLHLHMKTYEWLLDGIPAGTYTLKVQGKVSGASMIIHSYSGINVDNRLEAHEVSP